MISVDPVAVWHVPSLVMLPSELAAVAPRADRTPGGSVTPGRPPSWRLATAKWLVEPVAVVVELAVSTPRQMAPPVELQSADVTESSGPVFDSPGFVSIERSSVPASAAIVMWPW